jgi:uncharacterized protein
MKLELRKKSDHITREWSGGKTTQLIIFPRDASFAERNFQFRLSLATTEVEHSLFTQLPGVFRVIMILDGTLLLEHDMRYRKTLKKFETDNFRGDWTTKAHGKVTDFNLMTTGSACGSLRGITLPKGFPETVSLKGTLDISGIYVWKGKVTATGSNKQSLKLEEGDLLMFFAEELSDNIVLKADKDSEIVEARIGF